MTQPTCVKIYHQGLVSLLSTRHHDIYSNNDREGGIYAAGGHEDVMLFIISIKQANDVQTKITWFANKTFIHQ